MYRTLNEVSGRSTCTSFCVGSGIVILLTPQRARQKLDADDLAGCDRALTAQQREDAADEGVVGRRVKCDGDRLAGRVPANRPTSRPADRRTSDDLSQAADSNLGLFAALRV